MRFLPRLALFVFMAAIAAACSVGGGGSSSAPTTITPTKPNGAKSKSLITLHIPASRTATASRLSTASTGRGGVRHPQLVSAAANGLVIGVFTDAGLTQSVDTIDLDISGANTTTTTPAGDGATCTADNAGGRSCAITVVEPAGTYYFQISTFAIAPGSAGFPGAALDTGVTPAETLSPSAPNSIVLTLGGTIATIQLNLQKSVYAGGTSTVPIGIVALDAANEIIISSAAYSTPISLAVTADPIFTATVGVAASASGTPTYGATATSSNSTDIVSLQVTCCTANATGTQLALTATSGSASATAVLTPIFVTDTAGGVTTPATSPPGALVSLSSTATDTVTLAEGFANGNPFTGQYTIATDPNSPCTAANSPLAFTYNGGAATTTPPATLAPSGGAASFTVAASGSTPGNGCIYDVSDGTSDVFPLTIAATVSGATPVPTAAASFTAYVPGSLLYLTGFSQNQGSTNAAADPIATGPVTNPNILMYRVTDSPETMFTISDPNLQMPLGIAHDSGGDVFVADLLAETIDEYDPNDITPYPANASTPADYYFQTSSITSPDGLAFNTKTNTLYVSNYGTGMIYEYALPQTPGYNPNGRSRTAAIPTRVFAAAMLRASASSRAPAILRAPAMKRAASGPAVTDPTPYLVASFNVGGHPAGIAFDSSDDLFVVFPQTQTVSEYAPVDGVTGGQSVAITPSATVGPGLFTLPATVTVGSDGTIYVLDSGQEVIDAFMPANLTATSNRIQIGTSTFGFAVKGTVAYPTQVQGNGVVFVGPTGSPNLAATPPPVPFPVPGNTSAPPNYIPYATF